MTVALAVEALRVTFGGNVAVDDVNLTARAGHLTSLIGPNGAGKTTTFNACNGLLRPTAGRVLLDDRDVTRLGVSRRARAGLGRTFQRMQLFSSLSVYDNVALGREAAMAGSRFVGQVLTRRREAATVRASAEDALCLCGIEHLRDVAVGSLSTGQRRLVELARVLAGDFDVLLLDEPSSGLDVGETEAFGRVLRQVVDERGTTMLLVEHDMNLVMGVCDYIYVLDFGKLIFEGIPAEVAASELVREAYLGTGDI
jgi:ABC-type branched-subunit amino acid transport system ATPase component